MTTFSFRKTARRCILCVTQSNWVKMWFSRFPVLPGSAEAQVTWGGKVKCLLTAYFIGNISAKKISKSIHGCQSYSKPTVEHVFDTRCRQRETYATEPVENCNNKHKPGDESFLHITTNSYSCLCFQISHSKRLWTIVNECFESWYISPWCA